MTPLRLVVRLVSLLVLLAAPAAAQVKDGPAAGRALGLSEVVDYSTQQPFLDVMKTARSWVGHRPEGWGGHGVEDLRARGVLDADGWPTQIPSDMRAIGTILLTGLPPQAVSLAGRYRLTYDGDGIVQVGGRAQNVRYGEGAITFDFTPGDAGVHVDILSTDRQRTGDYIRNIRIVKEEHAARLEAGEIFNPDWTARIGGFGAVRFMDWMRTNDSAVSDWDTRPRLADVTWTEKGVPLEVMVALANEQRLDPWFNMPHLATDAFMQRFALYVRDHLDPELQVYVEFSNEVWNLQFEQARWAEAHAIDRWGAQYTGVQYYAVRALDMVRIWRAAFGPDAHRLTTVIATQTGWLGREEPILEAPLWVAEDPSRRAPGHSFDAYAVAGYFSGMLGHPDKIPTVRRWIADSRARAEAEADRQGLAGAERTAYLSAHRHDHAIRLAAAEALDGGTTGDRTNTVAEFVEEFVPYHRGVADRYGLDLVMYEGGSHVTAAIQHIHEDDLTEFFVALNYAPAMGDLYRVLLAGWDAGGGTLFNAFTDVAPPTRWGSWGHLRWLSDDTPRWQALTTTAPGQ